MKRKKIERAPRKIVTQIAFAEALLAQQERLAAERIVALEEWATEWRARQEVA